MNAKPFFHHVIALSLAAIQASCGGGDNVPGINNSLSSEECNRQGDVRYSIGRTTDAAYSDGTTSARVFTHDRWETVAAPVSWGVNAAVQSTLTRNVLTSNGMETRQTAEIVGIHDQQITRYAWLLGGKWYRATPPVVEPTTLTLGVRYSYTLDWLEADTGLKRAGAAVERQFLGAENGLWQGETVRLCRFVNRFLNGIDGTLDSETVLSFATGRYQGIPLRVMEDGTGRVLRELMTVAN